jgi:hypothetical protein
LSDNGQYESDCEWIAARRGHLDHNRLRIGLRLARMDKRYGAGVVEAVARDTSFGRSTLYEYQAVWMFLWQWRGFSARRIFEDCPTLTYTHLREVLRLPFEDRIDALEAAQVGDDRFETVIPMTPDAFKVYLDKLTGKTTPAKPLFDTQGWAHEVVSLLMREAGRWAKNKVRIIVREVEE